MASLHPASPTGRSSPGPGPVPVGRVHTRASATTAPSSSLLRPPLSPAAASAAAAIAAASSAATASPTSPHANSIGSSSSSSSRHRARMAAATAAATAASRSPSLAPNDPIALALSYALSQKALDGSEVGGSSSSSGSGSGTTASRSHPAAQPVSLSAGMLRAGAERSKLVALMEAQLAHAERQMAAAAAEEDGSAGASSAASSSADGLAAPAVPFASRFSKPVVLRAPVDRESFLPRSSHLNPNARLEVRLRGTAFGGSGNNGGAAAGEDEEDVFWRETFERETRAGSLYAERQRASAIPVTPVLLERELGTPALLHSMSMGGMGMGMGMGSIAEDEAGEMAAAAASALATRRSHAASPSPARGAASMRRQLSHQTLTTEGKRTLKRSALSPMARAKSMQQRSQPHPQSQQQQQARSQSQLQSRSQSRRGTLTISHSDASFAPSWSDESGQAASSPSNRAASPSASSPPRSPWASRSRSRSPSHSHSPSLSSSPSATTPSFLSPATAPRSVLGEDGVARAASPPEQQQQQQQEENQQPSPAQHSLSAFLLSAATEGSSNSRRASRRSSRRNSGRPPSVEGSRDLSSERAGGGGGGSGHSLPRPRSSNRSSISSPLFGGGRALSAQGARRRDSHALIAQGRPASPGTRDERALAAALARLDAEYAAADGECEGPPPPHWRHRGQPGAAAGGGGGEDPEEAAIKPSYVPNRIHPAWLRNRDDFKQYFGAGAGQGATGGAAGGGGGGSGSGKKKKNEHSKQKKQQQPTSQLGVSRSAGSLLLSSGVASALAAANASTAAMDALQPGAGASSTGAGGGSGAGTTGVGGPGTTPSGAISVRGGATGSGSSASGGVSSSGPGLVGVPLNGSPYPSSSLAQSVSHPSPSSALDLLALHAASKPLGARTTTDRRNLVALLDTVEYFARLPLFVREGLADLATLQRAAKDEVLFTRIHGTRFMWVYSGAVVASSSVTGEEFVAMRTQTEGIRSRIHGERARAKQRAEEEAERARLDAIRAEEERLASMDEAQIAAVRVEAARAAVAAAAAAAASAKRRNKMAPRFSPPKPKTKPEPESEPEPAAKASGEEEESKAETEAVAASSTPVLPSGSTLAIPAPGAGGGADKVSSSSPAPASPNALQRSGVTFSLPHAAESTPRARKQSVIGAAAAVGGGGGGGGGSMAPSPSSKTRSVQKDVVNPTTALAAPVAAEVDPDAEAMALPPVRGFEIGMSNASVWSTPTIRTLGSSSSGGNLGANQQSGVAVPSSSPSSTGSDAAAGADAGAAAAAPDASPPSPSESVSRNGMVFQRILVPGALFGQNDLFEASYAGQERVLRLKRYQLRLAKVLSDPRKQGGVGWTKLKTLVHVMITCRDKAPLDSVVAARPTLLLTWGHKALEKLMVATRERNLARVMEAMQGFKSSLFVGWSYKQLLSLATMVELREFGPGTVLYTQGVIDKPVWDEKTRMMRSAKEVFTERCNAAAAAAAAAQDAPRSRSSSPSRRTGGSGGGGSNLLSSDPSAPSSHSHSHSHALPRSVLNNWGHNPSNHSLFILTGGMLQLEKRCSLQSFQRWPASTHTWELQSSLRTRSFFGGFIRGRELVGGEALLGMEERDFTVRVPPGQRATCLVIRRAQYELLAHKRIQHAVHVAVQRLRTLASSTIQARIALRNHNVNTGLLTALQNAKAASTRHTGERSVNEYLLHVLRSSQGRSDVSASAQAALITHLPDNRAEKEREEKEAAAAAGGGAGSGGGDGGGSGSSGHHLHPPSVPPTPSATVLGGSGQSTQLSSSMSTFGQSPKNSPAFAPTIDSLVKPLLEAHGSNSLNPVAAAASAGANFAGLFGTPLIKAPYGRVEELIGKTRAKAEAMEEEARRERERERMQQQQQMGMSAQSPSTSPIHGGGGDGSPPHVRLTHRASRRQSNEAANEEEDHARFGMSVSVTVTAATEAGQEEEGEAEVVASASMVLMAAESGDSAPSPTGLISVQGEGGPTAPENGGTTPGPGASSGPTKTSPQRDRVPLSVRTGADSLVASPSSTPHARGLASSVSAPWFALHSPGAAAASLAGRGMSPSASAASLGGLNHSPSSSSSSPTGAGFFTPSKKTKGQAFRSSSARPGTSSTILHALQHSGASPRSPFGSGSAQGHGQDTPPVPSSPLRAGTPGPVASNTLTKRNQHQRSISAYINSLPIRAGSLGAMESDSARSPALAPALVSSSSALSSTRTLPPVPALLPPTHTPPRTTGASSGTKSAPKAKTGPGLSNSRSAASLSSPPSKGMHVAPAASQSTLMRKSASSSTLLPSILAPLSQALPSLLSGASPSATTSPAQAPAASSSSPSASASVQQQRQLSGGSGTVYAQRSLRAFHRVDHEARLVEARREDQVAARVHAEIAAAEAAAAAQAASHKAFQRQIQSKLSLYESRLRHAQQARENAYAAHIAEMSRNIQLSLHDNANNDPAAGSGATDPVAAAALLQTQVKLKQLLQDKAIAAAAASASALGSSNAYSWHTPSLLDDEAGSVVDGRARRSSVASITSSSCGSGGVVAAPPPLVPLTASELSSLGLSVPAAPLAVDDLSVVSREIWSRHIRYLTDLEAEQRLVYAAYKERKEALEAVLREHEEIRQTMLHKRYLHGQAGEGTTMALDSIVVAREQADAGGDKDPAREAQEKADAEWALQQEFAALNEEMMAMGAAGDPEGFFAQREADRSFDALNALNQNLEENASFTHKLLGGGVVSHPGAVAAAAAAAAGGGAGAGAAAGSGGGVGGVGASVSGGLVPSVVVSTPVLLDTVSAMAAAVAEQQQSLHPARVNPALQMELEQAEEPPITDVITIRRKKETHSHIVSNTGDPLCGGVVSLYFPAMPPPPDLRSRITLASLSSSAEYRAKTKSQSHLHSLGGAFSAEPEAKEEVTKSTILTQQPPPSAVEAMRTPPISTRRSS